MKKMLSWFCLILLPALVNAQVYFDNVDFGTVHIGTVALDQTWLIQNDSPTTAASYRIQSPTSPVILKSGSLAGVIPPLGSASVTFGFTAPATIPSPTHSYEQLLDVTSMVGAVENVDQMTISATVFGPTPVNSYKQLSGFTADRRLRTVLGWRSSTDRIDDLASIQIREVLRFFNTIPKPGLQSFAGYPNYCDVSTFGMIGFPLPWDPRTKYASNAINGLANIGGKPAPNLRHDSPLGDLFGGPGFQYLFDYHGTGNFILPYQQASYLTVQQYEWHLDYLQDSSGCPGWFPLNVGGFGISSDTIIRSVVLINGRWVCNIISTTTGASHNFDLAAVSVSNSTVGNSVKNLEVSWPTIGAFLQTSTSPSGPWVDIPTSTSTNVMAFPATNSVPSQFFRLRLP